uniref:Uncharacterized protein n=1 Tax=Marseillevirus LCMAC102 TaxID=2506603 RepID=A0A481YSZ8_9VIRU|nr:MAG: hypothetical protein LCMAC102_01980 [Marseillevirus LCMAC102]
MSNYSVSLKMRDGWFSLLDKYFSNFYINKPAEVKVKKGEYRDKSSIVGEYSLKGILNYSWLEKCAKIFDQGIVPGEENFCPEQDSLVVDINNIAQSHSFIPPILTINMFTCLAPLQKTINILNDKLNYNKNLISFDDEACAEAFVPFFQNNIHATHIFFDPQLDALWIKRKGSLFFMYRKTTITWEIILVDYIYLNFNKGFDWYEKHIHMLDKLCKWNKQFDVWKKRFEETKGESWDEPILRNIWTCRKSSSLKNLCICIVAQNNLPTGKLPLELIELVQNEQKFLI